MMLRNINENIHRYPHFMSWRDKSLCLIVNLFSFWGLWRTFSLPSWAFFLGLISPAGSIWPDGSWNLSSCFLSVVCLVFFGNGMLGALSCRSCSTSCLYRTACRVVHIFLVTVSLLKKCHFFWCGLAHHWIISVLVQDIEGSLVFLGHAAIACCGLVLNIGPRFVVLFATLPEEYVW